MVDPEISDEVEEQFREVRDSGEVNMIISGAVQREAHDRDFHELVTFIESASQPEYIELLQAVRGRSE